MTQSQKKFFNSNDARTLIQHYGFALFPIHGIVDGECTCGNKDCSNKGKHPATPNGFKDATNDIDALIKLWDKRKGLNVGIATGTISGIFVIDIDGEQGESDIKKLGELPQTLTVRTGRGRHLFFKHPGKEVKTRTKVIGDKVDVRGDGGYVAGPGSNHVSGATYEWENPINDPADAPEWLVNELEKEKGVLRGSLIPQLSAPLPRLFVSNNWSEADCIDLLGFINPDIGYDEWIKVGMAIQSEGFGFHIWDGWSSKGSKYQANTMATHWKSFKPGHGVSFGTLVKMAQDGGWGSKGNYFVEPTEMVKIDIIKDTKLTSNDIIKDTKSHKIDFIPISNIQHQTETNDFVHGLLAHNQLSVVYGESNCGKTFFMTDLCFHIATGRRWTDAWIRAGLYMWLWRARMGLETGLQRIG